MRKRKRKQKEGGRGGGERSIDGIPNKANIERPNGSAKSERGEIGNRIEPNLFDPRIFVTVSGEGSIGSMGRKIITPDRWMVSAGLEWRIISDVRDSFLSGDYPLDVTGFGNISNSVFLRSFAAPPNVNPSCYPILRSRMHRPLSPPPPSRILRIRPRIRNHR